MVEYSVQGIFNSGKDKNQEIVSHYSIYSHGKGPSRREPKTVFFFNSSFSFVDRQYRPCCNPCHHEAPRLILDPGGLLKFRVLKFRADNRHLIILGGFSLDSREQIAYAPSDKIEAYPPVEIRKAKDSKASGGGGYNIKLQTGLQLDP